MEKILKISLVLCFAFCTIPTFACSSDKAETVSGAACSISELNNLEKKKTDKGKTELEPKVEIDLRPVNKTPEIRSIDDRDCLFGECLYKTILGK